MDAIVPFNGESQPDFAARFHQLMQKAIPETDKRTQESFRVWDKYMAENDPLMQRAIRTFRPEEFKRIDNVPLFTEHTTKDARGNTMVYDRNALAAVLDRCNHRIADTGNFAPLTEGHTPDRESLAKGASMPAVLGYAGPYKLGMVGNENPRWAIFGTEWHDAQDADKLRKLRRRSPEIWLEERMEDRFFDPIAALGAETPRLDMGMIQFHRTSTGRNVAKYSVAAMPSATSVFVPSTDVGSKKKNYEGASNMALTPEDVTQVVDAIMDTEPMQWVVSQMGGGQMGAPESVTGTMAGGGDLAGGEDLTPEPIESPTPPEMAAPPTPEAPPVPEAPAAPGPAAPPEPQQLQADPMGGGVNPEEVAMPGDAMTPPDGQTDDSVAAYGCGKKGYQSEGEEVIEEDEEFDDAAMMQSYMAGDIDEEELQEYRAGKYAAAGNLNGGDGKQGGTGDIDSDTEGRMAPLGDVQASTYSRRRRENAKYARIAAENRATKSQVKTLKNRLAAVELDRARSSREAELVELSRYHAIDLEREIQRCDPLKMSEEHYADHKTVIRENYERIPVDVPQLYAPPLERNTGVDSYSKDEADQAVRYTLEQRRAGRQVSFPEALTHIRG
ncbi:hypothetical protein K0U83_22705 [bacterium]|nr:hypothetical protein [bacterium]